MSFETILITLSSTLLFLILLWGLSAFLLSQYLRKTELRSTERTLQQLSGLKENIVDRIGEFSQMLERRFGENLLQQSKESAEVQRKLQETLTRQSGELSQGLTLGLSNISLLVEKRLNEGFEKTTATFTDIVKRLALIDDAQKKLTELSSNVVSLQEILVDKRSRGAFGEVQLKNLVQNVLPPSHFAFQHTLSNGSRADCILFLPEPTGHIIIDSKFPLENYQIMTDFSLPDTDRKKAQQQFRQDIKKHISDIEEKYIIRNETSDGALMFIPAEAVFSEIHAHFPDLVELAHRSCVWLSSPTTLMAILTTARAVLKDNATRQHIHVIQNHLRLLADDFKRFEIRMNQLAKHIDQAHKDVQQVNTSAQKISNRFQQIDQTDLDAASMDASRIEVGSVEIIEETKLEEI